MARNVTLILGFLALLFVAGCAGPARQSSERWIDDYVQRDGKTGIEGRVYLKNDGSPIAGAYVNIYPDAVSNLLGPSMYISLPTDAQGRYHLDVPPGTYYVVARKRLSGRSMGPLSPGDYYSEHQRILVEVKAGKLAVADLPLVAIKAPMFFKKGLVDVQGDTGVRGRLVDAEGRPVPGGFATAYDDAEMRRLPDHASTLSDEKGNFTLYLPEAGTYYLGARIHAWDMPRPGEPHGRLGGETPTPIAVKKGTFVEDVVIEMHPFVGEYQAGKSRRPL